jgi:hypothetical protein
MIETGGQGDEVAESANDWDDSSRCQRLLSPVPSEDKYHEGHPHEGYNVVAEME